MRDNVQSAEGGVSPLGAEHQFDGDVFAACVVATIGKAAAGFFQRDFHVCNRPIIELGHVTTPPPAVVTSLGRSFTKGMISIFAVGKIWQTGEPESLDRLESRFPGQEPGHARSQPIRSCRALWGPGKPLP